MTTVDEIRAARIADGVLNQFDEWRKHDGKKTITEGLGADARGFLRQLIINYTKDLKEE